VMPPPAESSQRATKPPVSAHDSTEKVISTAARWHSAVVRQRTGRYTVEEKMEVQGKEWEQTSKIYCCAI
jgi:hypothetical protein